MIWFITKRLLISIPLLIGISLVTFLVINLAPGGQMALPGSEMNPEINPKIREMIAKQFYFDKPFHTQYIYMMRDMFTGELSSFKDNRSATLKVLERVPAKPVRTFHEALQFYWILEVVGHYLNMCGNGSGQRIDRNVRSAVYDLASSRLAVDLLSRAAFAARNNLDLVADNYTLGRVSLVDLIDAQTNAFNADLGVADAVNDYLLDLMRVERAVGQFMFFVSAEDREAWIQELESFSEDRR